MRILLVEDDRLLGDGIQRGLRQEGYNVDWIQDGLEAEAALGVESYDLVVLDLTLPRRSGLDILREQRRRNNQIPVLILTARDSVSDRIAGLDSGADDYVIKPFDLDELAARIRSLLRRSQGRANPLIEHGQLLIDPAAHTVTWQGQFLDLPPKEFILLQLLLENAGRVLTRSRLESALYGWNTDIESNAVEVHIHHLRKKLDRDLIRTVRGVGYLIDKVEG